MSKKINVLIALPGQQGDILSAMSVLRPEIRESLWGADHQITWLCSRPAYVDLFKYSDVTVSHFPEGWGLPERVELENSKLQSGELPWADLSLLKDSKNHLDQKIKHTSQYTKDFDLGYFPGPWQVSTTEQRAGIDYPSFSRRVFGVDPGTPWRPYIGWSAEEKERMRDFCSALPFKKTVMLETTFGSGVSPWDDQLTEQCMTRARNRFGQCNFIFASNIFNEKFSDKGVVSLKDFTVRQAALAIDYCDLFIGISSGLSVVTSAWGLKPVPKMQYCGSFISSTVTHACGPIHLIVTDPLHSNPPEHELLYPPNKNHRQNFLNKVADVLQSIGD